MPKGQDNPPPAPPGPTIPAVTTPSPFKVLSRKRDSLLRKWAASGYEIETAHRVAKEAVADPNKINAFHGRYTILKENYDKFLQATEDLHDLNVDLESLDPSTLEQGELIAIYPNEAQQKYAQNIRMYYIGMQEIHAKLSRQRPIETTAQTTLPNISVMDNSSVSALPKIQIPRFDGSHENWIPFRDVFVSLVHQRAEISNVQKFHYLLSALQGEARSVVIGIPITENDYAHAWKTLEDTYQNPRLLASVYLNKLLNFPKFEGKITPESLKLYMAGVIDAVTAFKGLKIQNESDFVLFSLAVRHLPRELREEFQKQQKTGTFPSTTDLAKFVRARQVAIQLANPEESFPVKKTNQPTPPNQSRNNVDKKSKPNRPSYSSGKTLTTHEASSAPIPTRPAIKCVICEEGHTLFRCSRFNQMTPLQRVQALKKWSGCRVCLTSHEHKQCSAKVKQCRLCNQSHNPMLCIGKKGDAPTKPKVSETSEIAQPSTSGATLSSLSSAAPPQEIQVLLGTLQLEVYDARGKVQSLRAVLDSGSQFTYITHKALNRLGLQCIKIPRKISTIGGALFDSAQGVTHCTIVGRKHVPDLQTECVIVKNIVSSLPTFPIPDVIRRKFAKYQLADPNFHKPSSVDMLLGADVFMELVCGSAKFVAENLPRLLPTVYGEVGWEKLTTSHPTSPREGTSLFSATITDDNLAFDLQKFWHVEEIPNAELPVPHITSDEELAETLYVQGRYRLPDGRFGVKLPFKTPKETFDISASKLMAEKRFFNLEAKFKKNPELKQAYCDFMNDYNNLGHMEPANEESRYVIPHHAVFNKHKIRVVFDGSCPTPQGSLNDHLLVGRALQNDIRDILLSFRNHRYAFTTDAVKMYRQIEVAPEDRAYQHILWRENPSEPLKSYQLNTVTYGLSSSPFHALRCIQELQEEHKSEFPLASHALKNHVYVDDVVTGSPSLPEALELQNQLSTVMKKGGFSLAKWASNSIEILQAVAKESREAPATSVDLSSENTSSLKVLGLKWNTDEDIFSYNIEEPNIAATKRGILSTVARIFDPLGIISPVTVAFKILIQKLWLAELKWDENIPEPLNKVWRHLIENLRDLSSIKIPRRITMDQPSNYQIIGFSDASESAMCCALYLRVITGDLISVNLLTAKTKVAPVRAKLTIPKLELTAALLLARLYHSTQAFRDNLNAPSLQPVFFTDSMITLAWMSRIPTSNLKIFVANRVAEIQKWTPENTWRHVAGSMNPADLGSRGVIPQQMLEERHNQLWFSGPSFLQAPEHSWPPSSTIDDNLDIPEIKAKVIAPSVSLLSYDNSFNFVDWMNRFSDYRTLIRVTARILRLVYNQRHKTKPRSGEFLLLEITQAFQACCKATQNYHFLHGKPSNFNKVQSDYRSLSPFMDDRGIIRVGGRLENAPIDSAHRHPVLLPPKSKFTNLLVQFYHRAFMHPGPNLLHSLIQRRVWIPHARRLVRTVARKCVICFSSRASVVIPKMGNLPGVRVTAARAFASTGIDFAGPFQHKTSLLRKAIISKMYFCVFVCMATKAVHIEPVTDLTTKAFLAAFSRFISRRGKPTHIFSDNGSNFIGAARELKELYKWFFDKDTQGALIRHGAEREISWSFSPPYSPHFGALWESAVKSIKTVLRSAVGDTPLTYEEFATLLAQTEAILNSRPLCPLSESPDEIDVLTPGHFLIGTALTAPPDQSILDQKMNHLHRWQIVRRAYQEIWKRFSLEYLSTLQKRVKWTRDNPSLQVGDLVLIRTNDLPPLKWPTARVVEIHPGSDERTRVVTIRMSDGTLFKRSSANLAPLLPVNSSSREEDDFVPTE